MTPLTSLGAFALLLAATPALALEVSLSPATPGPRPAGTTLLFTARATGEGTLGYRFRAAAAGQPLRLLRDFAPGPVLDWTPLAEGAYEVAVTARSLETGETAEASLGIQVLPVATGTPVVSPTAHPLVALYSAPPCPEGHLRVGFAAPGDLRPHYTPWAACGSGRSLNLHVAGLRAQTTYRLQHEVFVGGVLHARGPRLEHTTGAPPADVPRAAVLVPPEPDASLADEVLLFGMQWNNIQQSFPFATDLAGRLIWYYDRIRAPWQLGAYLVRPAPAGTFLVIANDPGVWRVLREIDLAGNTLRETTVPRVSEQLVALGHDPITSFHHEAVRLPNGHTLVLGTAERLVTDLQGPGVVDVLGDVLVDLDPDWQVAWAWTSFHHLDLARAATLGETCSGPAQGCPPIGLAPVANDWTHSNSVSYVGGDLVISVRNQDWVIKLDYRDGTGTGAVLWRLGREGDFTLLGGDDSRWFSHQHDAQAYDGGATIALFDNGNLRCDFEAPGGCSSRGQALVIDEAARTAALAVDADLGRYAPALGSAQRLGNGNYFFWSGLVTPGPHGEGFEVRTDGSPAFVAVSRTAYRAFRLRSLYGP